MSLLCLWRLARRSETHHCDGLLPQVVHKALRSLLLHCLSTPAACGLLCRSLGSRYDALVTQACRGFATSSSSCSAPTALLHAIRRRPCVATLALLRRRLRGLAGDGDAYVQARADRAREAIRLLQDVAGIRVLGRCSAHTGLHFDRRDTHSARYRRSHDRLGPDEALLVLCPQVPVRRCTRGGCCPCK